MTISDYDFVPETLMESTPEWVWRDAERCPTITHTSVREMKNESINSETAWTDGGLTFTELIRQEYSNGKFSAGSVKGHPVDTLYLQAEKDGVVTTQLLLRPDEMAAIAWVAAGAIWPTLLNMPRR